MGAPRWFVRMAIGAITAVTIAGMAPAWADTAYPPGPAPTAPPQVQVAPSAVRVLGIHFSRTGADILRWTIVGLVILAVGVVLVLATRRRRRPIAAEA